MSHDTHYRGLVSIKGVVCHDGRVALACNHRDEWDLPGGKLQIGESFAECLRREFAEELGIEVAWGWVIDAVPHHFHDDIIVIIVSCNLVSTAGLQPSGEHSDVRWFGVDDLDGLKIQPHYLNAIQRRIGNTSA